LTLEKALLSEYLNSLMIARSRLVIPGFWLLLMVWSLAACQAVAQSVTPAATPTPVDRLAAPPMPPRPSQADYGAQVYYGVCMACHGDRGQGLTDEWRAVWGEDANCWQSRCHGPDHPPEGFVIPETCCTAVLGAGTLTRFNTAKELFDYLTDTMPWWNPGSLTREQFWQLTAFLMRGHNALPDEITLDESNAAVFNVHPNVPPPENPRTSVLLVSGLLLLAAIFFAASAHYRL
jgi:cytochrome c5